MGKKMCAKYKSAFTLAETIMVLAIIGVVITAAIPSLTTKTLTDNGKLQSYCSIARHAQENICIKYNTAKKNLFSPCGTADASLCTAATSRLVIGSKEQLPLTYSDFSDKGFEYFPLTMLSTTNPDNLYNLFLSSRNIIRISDYYMKEEGSNFFLINDINADDNNKPLFPRATGQVSRNTIIGKITDNHNTLNAQNLVNNTILGSGNNLLSCNNHTLENNILYGTENTLCNDNHDTTNSITFGYNNKITNSNAIVIGSNNVTPTNNNVLYIGNDINPGAGSNLDFSINGIITSENVAARNITFAHNTEISGTYTGTFWHSSDIRLKNIKGNYNKGLKEILQIEPVRFYYNNDNSATEQIGVIAQDIQKIFPEAVVKMPSGYYGVDTDPIFFAMVNALKEVNEQTIKEEQRHEQLQKELEQLEKQLSQNNVCKPNNFLMKIWCWLTHLVGGINE